MTYCSWFAHKFGHELPGNAFLNESGKRFILQKCFNSKLYRSYDKVEDTYTLGPAYNEQKDAKETVRYKWVLVVTDHFNMAVNDFDSEQSACYSRMLVVTELVLSGIQCTKNLMSFYVSKICRSL